MEDIIDNKAIALTRSARDRGKQVIQGIQATREARQNETRGTWWSSSKEIPIEGELKTRIEQDIALAQSVLIDIGYTLNEATSCLPKTGQIHFYKTGGYSDSVRGGVANEGGRLQIDLASYVSEQNWRRIGPILTHELGHYPAQRVYGPGMEENSPIRLVSFGLDRKKLYLNIMGTQYFQQDTDDTYMNGVLREPLADLFGYYCTEKRGEGTPYHAQKYYRETAFTIALLQHLSEIRDTQFFDEFTRMYKSFNDRDYGYFVTLRDDFAKQWEQEGLSHEDALKKATKFVSNLNNIQSSGGMDCVQTGIEGDANGIHIVHHQLGGQLTDVATEAGFQDRFSQNVKAISESGLVLNNAETVMTRDVNR